MTVLADLYDAAVPRVTQQTRWSCGPASLRAVLAAYGDVRDEPTLNRLCKCTRGTGTSEVDLIAGAQMLGYRAFSHRFTDPRELTKLTTRGVPVICVCVSWNIPGSFHWVVVEGVADGLVQIMDPHPPAGVDNRRVIHEDAWAKRWWHREGLWIFTHRVNHLGVIVEPKAERAGC